MRVFVRLLEEQAERCIQLAYQCQNKNAERILRMLAVDLMLAAEEQRIRLPELLRDIMPAGELAGTPKQRRASNPEMLRELEALSLIVRSDSLTV